MDPAEDWQVVLRCQEPLEILSAYKCLWTLVLVEAEAFLYRTEKASEVVNGPPKETILRFGLPVSIPSNNWRFFLARMTREVPRALNLHQKLHTSW